MELIEGQIRNMREELAKANTPKDTDEIRESYKFGSFLANITYMPAGETQDIHKHFLLKEAIQVLSGEMQAYHDGSWTPVKQREAANFEIGEYHTTGTREITEPVIYPGATDRIAAVTIAYKWIPPFLNVTKDESKLLFNVDWFGEKYETNKNDKNTSPLLRADEQIQEEFWEIVDRNKSKLS